MVHNEPKPAISIIHARSTAALSCTTTAELKSDRKLQSQKYLLFGPSQKKKKFADS